MNTVKNQAFPQKWADALWQATDDLKCLHAVYMETGLLVLNEVLNAIQQDAAALREASPTCSDRLEYYGAMLSMLAREYQTVTLDTGNILRRLDAMYETMTERGAL